MTDKNSRGIVVLGPKNFEGKSYDIFGKRYKADYLSFTCEKYDNERLRHERRQQLGMVE